VVPRLAEFGAIDRWSSSMPVYPGALWDNDRSRSLWSVLVRIRSSSPRPWATRDAQVSTAPAVGYWGISGRRRTRSRLRSMTTMAHHDQPQDKAWTRVSVRDSQAHDEPRMHLPVPVVRLARYQWSPGNSANERVAACRVRESSMRAVVLSLVSSIYVRLRSLIFKSMWQCRSRTLTVFGELLF
jgi:hypothetical protein